MPETNNINFKNFLRSFSDPIRYIWYGVTGKHILGKTLAGIEPVPSGFYPGIFWDRLNWKKGKLSLAQQGEDLVLDRIISRVLYKSLYSKGYFIEVGAFHAFKDSVVYSLYKRGWKGISVDPSLVCEKSFARHRPRDKFYRCLVSSRDTKGVDFYINNNSKVDSHTGNTMYPDDPNRYRKTVIPSRSLNSILEENQISSIDVLCIDVEGAELDVLQGFNIKKFSPSIIVVEIVCSSLNDLFVQPNPVHQLIIDNGYQLVASCVITQFYVKESCINNNAKQ